MKTNDSPTQLINPQMPRREKTHFRKRAFERYGLIISDSELIQIRNQIINREARFIGWSVNDQHYRAFYMVTIQGEDYIVLYDLERNGLVTILCKKWFRKTEEGFEIRPPKERNFLDNFKRRKW